MTNAMESPLIGITTCNRNLKGDVSLPSAYIDMLQDAGATIVLLPPQAKPESLIKCLDGLIIAGGGDICPQFYGGNYHSELSNFNEERDIFELVLAEAAIEKRIPVLGICRGMQVLAVASGVGLIAHIPDVYGDSVIHRSCYSRCPVKHRVDVRPNSLLSNLIGTTVIHPISWHHQAIQAVPMGWQLAAESEDGLIEAIEHLHHPWLVAVQWHPELSAQDTSSKKLFQAMVQASIV
jgi:putative glutamine amidotransferase